MKRMSIGSRWLGWMVVVAGAGAAWSAGSIAAALPTLVCQTTPPRGDAPPATGEHGEPVSATGKAAANAADKVINQNFVLAAVNEEVVTLRDVLLEWRLEGRRNADPDRPVAPHTDSERLEAAKRIVMDRLWLAHARRLPIWDLNISKRLVEEVAGDLFGSLWTDPAIPADERDLMRAKAESRLAIQLSLNFDLEYRRCMVARPEDVQRIWDATPAIHRVSTKAKLGRVILGREVYGPQTADLAQQIRQRAIEKSSLETAAQELAPGSYAATKEYDLEHDADLRDEVLAFARTAEPGELSTPVVGEKSVMLFTLLSRQPGHDVSYEEAAPKIKALIESGRCDFRAQQYFIFKILPEAFFVPTELFDDEIEQLRPGMKAERARMHAEAHKGK